MTTFTVGITYYVVTCDQCGISFGVPNTWDDQRRADHKSFHCPNGHSLSYRGQTEVDRLKAALESKERALTWEREQRESANRRAVSAEMSRRVTKGHLTRIKKRVGSGVCPCCNRTFHQLARHMAAKHPEFRQGP